MKKIILYIGMMGFLAIKAGDKNKNVPAVTALPKDMKTELRKKDSISYLNLATDAKNYTFQNTPNELVLNIGIKLTFVQLHRFSIPRGVNVAIPDTVTQRYAYELAEVEMKATNTTSGVLKFDNSEPVFTALKLFSQENNFKAYTYQYPLSFGSIFLNTEPAQPDRMKSTYAESNDFFNMPYKPGQTKTCRGIVVALAKSAQHIDRILITAKEFGQNISYGCPATL